jgi:hypothetical protein
VIGTRTRELSRNGAAGARTGAHRPTNGNATTVYGIETAVKGFGAVPMMGPWRSAGGVDRNDKESPMKTKIYQVGLTVAMLAVLVESLGASMKWQ